MIISSVDIENSANSAEIERCAGLDVDEDVDTYYKQKMLPDTSTNNSMQQSPHFVEEARRGRRRSPSNILFMLFIIENLFSESNSSPERHLLPFPLTETEIHSFPKEMSASTIAPTQSNNEGCSSLMTHSCINPPTTNILGSYSNSKNLDYGCPLSNSSFYYNHSRIL